MSNKFLNKSIICLTFILLITGLSLYFYEYNKENKTIDIKPNTNQTEYKLTLGMVGDALYHIGTYNDGLKSDGTYNFDHQLADIKPIISTYDLAYYNQETILGGKKLGLSTYPRFNSPEEVGDAFINAGFNLVSLANNHTLDRGEQAILNSINYWQNKPVMTAGSYSSKDDSLRSHINEKNGITYAFFAYTDLTNGLKTPKGKEYLVNVFNKEKVTNDINAIKNQVDVIIVAMHWGNEYTHTPTKTQTEEAEFLSSLGINIIIGSHPHVIEPIEHINDTVVIYSLGNFISGQEGLMKKIGLLASLEIHKTVQNNKKTITINNIKGDLLYTYHNNHQNYRVIPFAKLNNNLLNDYQNIKTTYEAIINKNDKSILVGTLSTN